MKPTQPRTSLFLTVACLPLPSLLQFLNKHLPQAADHIFGVSNVHEKPGPHQPGMSTSLAAAANLPGCAARHGLLFVGNYAHQPNIDAVVFLLEDVLPRIR